MTQQTYEIEIPQLRFGLRLAVDDAVSHDGAGPSHIVLPVIPAGGHDQNMKSDKKS